MKSIGQPLADCDCVLQKIVKEYKSKLNNSYDTYIE